MKRRRVKITGLGFVTPAGVGNLQFEAGILESRSRVGRVTRFPADAGPFVAAEVDGFNVNQFLGGSKVDRLPRHTQFALVATQFALRDAGLDGANLGRYDPVVMTGTSLMDSDIISRTIENSLTKGHRFALSRVVFHAPVAAVGAAVAHFVGGAKTLALQSACCSGLDAMGHAAEAVASGLTDLAITGGTEAPIYFHPMLELRMAGLSPGLSERVDRICRPFDLWRTTGVIGEGACMAVIEPESSPREGYAFIEGYAYASDGAQQLGVGLEVAIKEAMANARLHPSEVEHISAWGPGHREIDAAEVASLHRVFGSDLKLIPAVSLKGAIGNPFAAAGAIQVGTAALGMRRRFIPPTVNWKYPDPSCALNLSASPRYIRSRITLVNSHGLSGSNSALFLRANEALK